MNEKDEKEKTIELDTPTLSITAETPDGLVHEHYFSENTPSGEIVTGSTTDLGIQLKPEEKKEFVEKIDVVKTYVSEAETNFLGFKFKIKRSPKKIIKSFSG